jgi:hypothetical protein
MIMPIILKLIFKCILGETGFVYVANGLQAQSGIDAVYDLTLAYSPVVPQTEVSVFTGFPTGNSPLFISFYVDNCVYNNCEERWLKCAML